MSQTTPAIESTDPNVRLQTIAQLAKIGGAVAISNLVLLLVDADEPVREAAQKALDQLDANWPKSEAAQRAIPRLEAALQHDNYWVGLAASTVLQLISGEVEHNPTVEKTTIIDRSAEQKRAAARILSTTLKDADVDFRLMAAETLGRLGQAEFADGLSVSLHDADEWVRWHAAHSLQAMNWQPADEKQKALWLVLLNQWEAAAELGAATTEPLLSALQSVKSKTREGAAATLGKLKAASAAPDLMICLQDPQKSVRRAAAKALAIINPKNLSPQQRALIAEESKG